MVVQGNNNSFNSVNKIAIVLLLGALFVRELHQRKFLRLPKDTVIVRDGSNHRHHYVAWDNDTTYNETNVMSACILIKNDNRRLTEWLAYHYTVMPLRHLIVGSDVNSTEDPIEVLHRWNGTSLNYQLWYGDDLFRKFHQRQNDETMKYIERQSYFYALCMQHFHRQGNLTWVALSDSDEYVKLNPLDDALNAKFFPNNQPNQNLQDENSVKHLFGVNETWWDRILTRKALRQRLGLDEDESNLNLTSIPTVADVLEDYSSQHNTLPCHTMPRLQYSAVLYNFTTLSTSICRPKLDPEITASINVTKFTTIRYLYHVDPAGFSHNKWSKVLIDLRRYSHDDLFVITSHLNPHSPLKECAMPAFAPDVASILRVNHYLNDFDVYTGREGDPRKKGKFHWSQSAHFRGQTTCDHMHAWLNEFVKHFGMVHAKYLLGYELESL